MILQIFMYSPCAASGKEIGCLVLEYGFQSWTPHWFHKAHGVSDKLEKGSFPWIYNFHFNTNDTKYYEYSCIRAVCCERK